MCFVGLRVERSVGPARGSGSPPQVPATVCQRIIVDHHRPGDGPHLAARRYRARRAAAAQIQLVFAAYYASTLSYSFFIKGLVLLDALLLAGLYTLRIIAGSAAEEVPLSFWLLLFAVFLFLSLAFVKRFAELEALRRQQRLRAAGRGYHVEDLPLLQSLGTASGYLSVLVLSLYINSPDIQALYHRPKLIWMLCVLMLYWISRVWMKAPARQDARRPGHFCDQGPCQSGHRAACSRYCRSCHLRRGLSNLASGAGRAEPFLSNDYGSYLRHHIIAAHGLPPADGQGGDALKGCWL